MIRGIEDKHEHSAQKLARDTRPLGTRIAEFLGNPQTMFIMVGTGIVVCFVFPIAADLTFFTILCLFIFAYTRKHTLPYRMPKSASTPD